MFVLIPSWHDTAGFMIEKRRVAPAAAETGKSPSFWALTQAVHVKLAPAPVAVQKYPSRRLQA